MIKRFYTTTACPNYLGCHDWRCSLLLLMIVLIRWCLGGIGGFVKLWRDRLSHSSTFCVQSSYPVTSAPSDLRWSYVDGWCSLIEIVCNKSRLRWHSLCGWSFPCVRHLKGSWRTSCRCGSCCCLSRRGKRIGSWSTLMILLYSSITRVGLR